METGREIKNKIDELLMTVEHTVDLFEEYYDEAISYRNEFTQEFLRRTRDDKWKKFIEKSSFNLETKDTHLELDISPRYHEFWDRVEDDQVPPYVDISNEINYDTLAEKNWLNRKGREILEIHRIIEKNDVSKTFLKSSKQKLIYRISLRSEYRKVKGILGIIYNELRKEDIIHNDTTLKMFEDVFSSDNLLKSDAQITFNTIPVEIGFTISILFKELFSGIIETQMEKSKSFYYISEGERTILEASTTHKARSQAKFFGTDEKHKENIQRILNRIKENSKNS